MKRHIAYLKYILRHKYWVFIASKASGCSLWRALIHDISKFRPSEWFPYANTFYDKNGKSQYIKSDDFEKAWLLHQHRNPHHWQYWYLKEDSGKEVPVSMPTKYVREMIADWAGAGRAITGKWELSLWYYKNRDKIILEYETKIFVETILSHPLFRNERNI